VGIAAGLLNATAATMNRAVNAIEIVSYSLIPSPIDQNPCAHWRKPMDMMRQG
jgi:hypothetical protein